MPAPRLGSREGGGPEQQALRQQRVSSAWTQDLFPKAILPDATYGF